ncbi:MAG: hypothetical protein IJ300_02985, partial [Clostridia bacterium]|nr:hypothetical protein [Clostridia bacterium]
EDIKMSTAKSSGKQIIALLLALITLLSVIPIMPVSAETLSDGKAQTVGVAITVILLAIFGLCFVKEK